MANNEKQKIYQQRINVSFDYPVVFTEDVFGMDNRVLEEAIAGGDINKCHRMVVYLDSGVFQTTPGIVEKIKAYFQVRSSILQMACDVKILPGGREIKTNVRIASDIVTMLGDLGMDRQSFVIAVGGGSLLDAVGLAVSVVHRGLRLIRIPTTTLAQDDAGIGVKNGLDIRKSKNFIGTFAPPFAVINDILFIATLDDHDYIAGIAEAFKVAMIKDGEFFDYLCKNVDSIRNRDRSKVEYVIRRCAQLHLDHIRNSDDPFELGSTRPLDFGHWAGHELEVMSDYALSHGHAVAIGIAIDSYIAMTLGLLSQTEFNKTIAALKGCRLNIWSDYLGHRDNDGKLCVLKGLDNFKEHLGGELTIPLPKGIGTMVEVNEIDADLVEDAVEYLKGIR